MLSLKIVQPGKLASSACRPIHYYSINDGVIGAKQEKRRKTNGMIDAVKVSA